MTHYFSKDYGKNINISLLLWFCLVGESQIGSGEFLKSGRWILNSVVLFIVVNTLRPANKKSRPFERRRSSGQNKTLACCCYFLEIFKKCSFLGCLFMKWVSWQSKPLSRCTVENSGSSPVESLLIFGLWSKKKDSQLANLTLFLTYI